MVRHMRQTYRLHALDQHYSKPLLPALVNFLFQYRYWLGRLRLPRLGVRRRLLLLGVGGGRTEGGSSLSSGRAGCGSLLGGRGRAGELMAQVEWCMWMYVVGAGRLLGSRAGEVRGVQFEGLE